jgi:hypothetical protein
VYDFRRLLLIASAALALGGLPADALGHGSHGSRPDVVRRWNTIAVDASGYDHDLPAPQQLGPGRSARAMAIVHIAMFEVVNAIYGGYESYIGLRRAESGTSLDAAVATAAHDTLVALFPAQAAGFDEKLRDELRRVYDKRVRLRGIQLGQRAADEILEKRAGDGSDHPEPLYGVDHIAGNAAGDWRQDPIVPIPLALGAHWDDVEPFVLESADQFRVPPPPPLDSQAYADAFNEVKAYGGDGVNTLTVRTQDQTEAGIYWAYDGTPVLCAPPRLYNQIAIAIADKQRSDLKNTARLLALVNVAMADAGIAIWESKYFYDLWRPVTGIREADPGTGPSGLGDGNDDTIGDPTFSPLGAPASNAGPLAKNFTPPFPAYPSGHAGFGGALFQILRRFYGTDRIAFTFVSDELNGVTEDNEGHPRPLRPRSFGRLSQAEEENGQSRIYLGIHWAFDKTEGIAQGRKVANEVYDNLYRRTRR